MKNPGWFCHVAKSWSAEQNVGLFGVGVRYASETNHFLRHFVLSNQILIKHNRRAVQITVGVDVQVTHQY